MLNNKTLLITGGTGSFGTHCAIHLLKNYKLDKLIIFSRDELKQYNLSNLLKKIKSKTKIRFFIGDVRDKERLKLAFDSVDYVIHAAALKQIPTAEYNPQECIRTNINGAENVIIAAIEKKVKKVIALSTDKACNPINLYGATKLAADKLFVAGNTLVGKIKTPTFSVVRYGNVINSRGSVIPLFKNLYKSKKKEFPITHKEMTRFFITLDQSVKFVLASFKRMKGGEIFIPKLPTIKIVDIVKAIDKNAKIKMVGIRPGEKIHELLTSKDEYINTLSFKDHYVIIPTLYSSIKKYLTNPLMEKGRKTSEGFEYVSSNKEARLDVKEIKKILNQSVQN